MDQLETNSGGPGKPRNVALRQAEGEFVLFVDSDDYINKETLRMQQHLLMNIIQMFC